MTTPPTIELCPRCRVHVLYVGRCYHCAFTGAGVVYRKEVADAATGE